MLAAHPEVEEETGFAGDEAAVHSIWDAFDPIRAVPLEVVCQNLPDELTGDVDFRL